jgi:hypothetical protein
MTFVREKGVVIETASDTRYWKNVAPAGVDRKPMYDAVEAKVELIKAEGKQWHLELTTSASCNNFLPAGLVRVWAPALPPAPLPANLKRRETAAETKPKD